MKRRDIWINQFLSALSPPSITTSNIAEAMEIKDRNLPQSLFRYRRVCEYSLRELRTDTVWLTPPEEFNDPYDSAIRVAYAQLRAAIGRRMFPGLSRDLQRHLSPDELREVAAADDPVEALGPVLLSKSETLNAEQQKLLLDMLSSFQQKSTNQLEALNEGFRSHLSISCFSATDSSLVMWSHYADRHHGFCVEYDVAALPPADIRRRLLFPVIYSEKLFDATPYYEQAATTESFNNLFRLLASIHKAPEWEYEQEWRLVIPAKPPAVPQSYPMSTPTAVYLGAKMMASERDAVASIVRPRGIRAINMRLAKESFRIEPCEA